MNWSWSYCAEYCEKTYGAYVDWEEEFFNCPECGEPIYKCDWEDNDTWTICPVCEFDFVTSEMVHDEDEYDEEEDDE